MKQCRKCLIVKEDHEFGKRKAMRDGLKSWCKKCESEDQKERSLKNPERQKEISKKTRVRNREKRLEYMREWHSKNTELEEQYRKEYKQRQDVKERNRIRSSEERRRRGIKVRVKEPRDEYLRKANARAKEYYKENKPKVTVYKRHWQRRKLDTDLHFKVRQRLSKRIYAALKGSCCSERTLQLIGCSLSKLINHIELQFKPGMTWDNYGEWHIDHIKPCASFDLKKEDDRYKCFNFNNLQPLWAFDNMSKGAKQLAEFT